MHRDLKPRSGDAVGPSGSGGLRPRAGQRGTHGRRRCAQDRCGDADRRRTSRGHGPLHEPGPEPRGVRIGLPRRPVCVRADCVRDADRPASVPEVLSPSETMHAIAHDEPPPLLAANTRVPPMLRWIVSCLAKAPEAVRRDRQSLSRSTHAARPPRRGRWRRGEPRKGSREGSTQARARRGRACRHAWARRGTLSGRARHPRARYVAAPLHAVRDGTRFESLPAWSPDGQTLAYSAEVDGTLQIFTRGATAATGAAVTDLAHDCTYRSGRLTASGSSSCRSPRSAPGSGLLAPPVAESGRCCSMR